LEFGIRNSESRVRSRILNAEFGIPNWQVSLGPLTQNDPHPVLPPVVGKRNRGGVDGDIVK